MGLKCLHGHRGGGRYPRVHNSMQSWKWTNLPERSTLITPYTPTRNLRSASKDALMLPVCCHQHCVRMVNVVFSWLHLILWNNLPLHIKLPLSQVSRLFSKHFCSIHRHTYLLFCSSERIETFFLLDVVEAL